MLSALVHLVVWLQLKKRLQEFEARWFFQQLIIGLDYCHKVSHAVLLA